MRPSDYLDKVRDALGVSSDYALQKPLNVSKQRISAFRNNKEAFSDETCKAIASILGIHPGFVMLDMQRERAKTPEEQAIWSDVLKGFHLPLRARANVGMAI